MNIDLERHAAAKVKRALDDVYQLTDDPRQLIRIALLASGVCIGDAAGFLRGLAHIAGEEMSLAEAMNQIIDMLKVATSEDPEVVLAKMRKAAE